MENTKHSPAPWNCSPNMSTSHIYHVYDENNNFFANDEIDCATQVANARLIAAAPELLACLKDFLECGQNAGHNQQLLINCRAAVAKARGAK